MTCFPGKPSYQCITESPGLEKNELVKWIWQKMDKEKDWWNRIIVETEAENTRQIWKNYMH